jgi:diguanylate cyclase (GGDEF)-like protein
VRENDTVARFGGDEFIVMLIDLPCDKAEAQAKAHTVAEKLRLKLAEPYVLKATHKGGEADSIVHRCTASIGVTLFINNGFAQDDIVKWADTAMYLAKEGGRNTVQFYTAPGSEPG